MGARTTEEVFTICQPKEMPVLSGRSLVPWLCGVLKWYLH